MAVPLRQAARFCLKQPALSSSLVTKSAVRIAGAQSAQNVHKRTYVTESKKDAAQVNVDTAIRADQKAFLAETGKKPQEEVVPGTGLSGDAMMSPVAGW